MPFFWKSNEKIESRLHAYFDLCDRCFQEFEKAVAVYFDTGPGAAFDAAVQRTHQQESAADDLRRDIEFTLYGRALLPESRGDLLGLLEAYDKLLSAAEGVLFDLSCQRITIPAGWVQDFRALVLTNLEAYYLIRKTVDALMTNPRITLHAAKQVDLKESESDRIERELVTAIFASTLDKADMIELRDLIRAINRISDLAEHTSDRIGIIAIKRQI